MATFNAVCFYAIMAVTLLTMMYYSFDMDQCETNLEISHYRKSSSMFASSNTPFDMHRKDVLVLIHIQKTGGSTFRRHVTKDLKYNPCTCKAGRKSCVCRRPGSKTGQWLFHEHVWPYNWACGLHADWTEMINCVPSMVDAIEKVHKKRRYFLATMLRNPLKRYLSEWQHVQRGATWGKSLHLCDGRLPTNEELPLCYENTTWEGVSLDEFIACPHNLAANRQTRMLSNMSEVGCYTSKFPDAERRARMLESAKRNLNHLAFFGITEYQVDTQRLFEKTFKLTFRKDFEQVNDSHAAEVMRNVSDDQIRQIHKLNAEDFVLYEYAKGIFFNRLNKKVKL